MTDLLTPFDLHRVEVGGEIGRRIDMTLRRNLLVLDVDKDFIAPFRHQEGITDGRATHYVALGKLIDAAVSFAAYIGDPEVASFKDHIVRETVKAQGPDGYIGTMKPAERMQRNYDIHEMAYIVLGLARNYGQFGDDASVKAAVGLANYIMDNWAGANQKLTTCGLEQAFIALSNVTGDRAYSDFSADTKMGKRIGYATLREWQRPVEGHTYRYLARCLAQQDLYRVQPQDSLLNQSRRAVEYLTSSDGLVITGTCSYGEVWHGDQNGSGHLGESCATAYLIRLLDSLIRLEGDLRYGDIMERSIYNALFGAQSTDGRRLRYYTAFEGGRTYFDEERSAKNPDEPKVRLNSYDTYCCPGNFRRIMAELPSKVYYRTADGLAINLYTSSAAEIDLGEGVSLAVQQKTDYPNSGDVEIYLTPSKSITFPLRLRIPRWCSQGQVLVNGEPEDGPVVGGTSIEITRNWEAGDLVTLHMPMPWRFIRGRKRQAGRVALMRGPVLYCLGPAHNNGLTTGVDLSKITIDLASLEAPTEDDTVRPGGLKCSVLARYGDRDSKQSPDLRLHPTEFPDPTGEAVYFVPSEDIAVPDELID